MRNLRNLCGLINLNKPSGITSRAAVNRVARVMRKVKVGHAGTLDPLASGVLVVCVGPATRLIESVQAMPKTYRVTIRLGATSDTLDADGAIVEHPDPRIPSVADIRQALDRQTGSIEQLPPAYSALKVQGVRAYELARAGRPVELAPRTVRIHSIAIVAYQWPHLELEVVCGGGTYIRSIARDLGEALRCGGLVDVLVRTRIGSFAIDSAVDPSALTAESLAEHLRPMLEAVPDLPRLVLDDEQVGEVAQGKSIAIPPTPAGEESGLEVALLDPRGGLIAIGQRSSTGDRVQPRKVLIADGEATPTRGRSVPQ